MKRWTLAVDVLATMFVLSAAPNAANANKECTREGLARIIHA